MDADVSLECGDQAASPGCAVANKLWRGHRLILQVAVNYREGLRIRC